MWQKSCNRYILYIYTRLKFIYIYYQIWNYAYIYIIFPSSQVLVLKSSKDRAGMWQEALILFDVFSVNSDGADIRSFNTALRAIAASGLEGGRVIQMEVGWFGSTPPAPLFLVKLACDLTRVPHPKWWWKGREMGTPYWKGKTIRLVKYYSIWPDCLTMDKHNLWFFKWKGPNTNLHGVHS